MAIHNSKSKSIIDIVWQATRDIQEQYLGQHTMNIITSMPHDTTVEKFNIIIAILKVSNHLRMERFKIKDQTERMTEAKYNSLIATVGQYARDNGIAWHYLGEIISTLSWEIFCDTGGEYDEDILTAYIKWEATQEVIFNDISSSKKYWKFKWLSWVEIEWHGPKSIIALTEAQVLDLIHWDLRLEWREDLVELILDKDKIEENGSRYRGMLSSYMSYILNPTNDDNAFIKLFNKIKEKEKTPEVTKTEDVTITDNKETKTNIDLEF